LRSYSNNFVPILAFPFRPCAYEVCSINSGRVRPGPAKTTTPSISPFVMSNPFSAAWPRASPQRGVSVLTKQMTIGLPFPIMARSPGGGLASRATTSAHGAVVANDFVKSRYSMICALVPCQVGSALMTACSTFACGKGVAAAAARCGTEPATSSAKHPIANLVRIFVGKAPDAKTIKRRQLAFDNIQIRLTIRPLRAPSRR